MIPKLDCDARPMGQRPLCLLPVVYRKRASAGSRQLNEWFHSWLPESFFSAGEGRSSLQAWVSYCVGHREGVVWSGGLPLF